METIQLANDQFLPHVCALVSEGHTVSLRARGYSMRPFIENDRDVAILGRSDIYKVGDVVLAEISPGHYVLHRIDAIRGNRVRLRGDGNYPGTEQCMMDDIRAIMCAVERKGKRWDTNGRVWKTYSWIWIRLLPMRRYLLALYKLVCLHQLPNRIRRMFK